MGDNGHLQIISKFSNASGGTPDTPKSRANSVILLGDGGRRTFQIMCNFSHPSRGWGTPDTPGYPCKLSNPSQKSCANTVILLGDGGRRTPPNHVQLQQSFGGMGDTGHHQIMCKFNNPSGGWGAPDCLKSGIQ